MTIDLESQITHDSGDSVIAFIPEIDPGAERILDFGCGNGDTLMRLRNESGCAELYGIDIRIEYTDILEKRLDQSWIMDLGEPDTELGDRFFDFFNYILMLDVVEHLYDPWYVLPKLAKYLAPTGKIIISVPNLRHWALWFNIIIGQFPYGKSGGLMNEEHIRWFTFDGIKELIELSGLTLVGARLTFPPNVDIEMMKERLKSPIPELIIPPPETTSVAQPTVISFPKIQDINNHYPYFLANKIIAVCMRGPTLTEPVRTSVGVLEERRKQLLK